MAVRGEKCKLSEANNLGDGKKRKKYTISFNKSLIFVMLRFGISIFWPKIGTASEDCGNTWASRNRNTVWDKRIVIPGITRNYNKVPKLIEIPGDSGVEMNQILHKVDNLIRKKLL